MTQDCLVELVGLLLLFLALLMSVCLNVILCIRRRASLCEDKGDCCYPHINEGEGPSQDEGNYFHDLNHRNRQENPHELQENPIYGNISSDRGDVCYEMMTMQRTREHLKPLKTDLNYASLDLKMAKKRKRKHQHRQDQAQLPAHLSAFLDVEGDVEGDLDAHLPPRDTSTMVSHSSIYLNSQQIAQETEEMGRERSVDGGWEEDGGAGEWKGEQESEDGKDRDGVGNGTVCPLLAEVQASEPT